MESTTKRVRASNWTEQDKKILKKLVLERSHIIEKKECSTNTNAAKKACWEEVLTCFNSLNANKRDMHQLQTQWRNMKGRAKKADFEYRRARNLTGGGPPPPSPPAADMELIQALPNEFAIDDNIFDSDSIHISQPEQLPISESPHLIQPENIQPEGEIPNDIMPIEIIPESPVPELAEMRQSTHTTNRPRKRRRNVFHPECSSTEHEHQLFVLAKAARREAMLRDKEAHEWRMTYEREVHERRMANLALEEEYLKLKIINLK